MNATPYKIEGPAIISFSGGRTSAYLLHQIVQAHGGELPDDVRVTFANTGKEREETLRFVHECGSRWGVKIHWLEWRAGKPCFEEVGYNCASRNGEPFAALIKKRKYTPNALTRFCTSELKVRVLQQFARSLGWRTWANVIGLRYDEGHRVLKAIDRNETGKQPYKSLMPLSKAKATKRDVMAFWAKQPFDLGLRGNEGNCDACFLKGRGNLLALIRENPSIVDWWIAQESTAKGRFRKEYSYTELARNVANQGFLFEDDGQDYDAECGLVCGGAQ